MQPVWLIPPRDVQTAKKLAEALDIHPALALVMANRGFAEPSAARNFLQPSLAGLQAEKSLIDMDVAAQRVIKAIAEGEPIGIHGDFDVDGVCASALLIDFLGSLGVPVFSFIPNRMDHGYGMSVAGVDKLKQNGSGLIIAVDCGISDHEAILYANSLGMDVIVLDHHQVPEKLPQARAVVNPFRSDCPSGLVELAGVGVAFYFAVETRSRLREQGYFHDREEPNLKQLLDLVALGTVADVMPLTGMNRLLVKYGLEQINAGKRLGVRMLRHVAGLAEREVTAGNLSFHLAPRINAAGRVDDARAALDLLITTDLEKARAGAEELDRLNQTRQRVEERILSESLEQIESDPLFDKTGSVVVSGVGWHPGVIGIVASRLVERFYRPSVVITLNEGMGRGSLRSIPGFNLVGALRECRGLLVRYGGHSMAAGITLLEEHLASFRDEFDKTVRQKVSEKELKPSLKVDAEWPLNQVDMRMAKNLEKMAPFGIGNPEPTFCARGVTVKHARMAKSSTLIMTLAEKEATIQAIAFRFEQSCPEPGQVLDILYSPEIDTFHNEPRPRIKIKAVKNPLT